jgi:uncharacterized RDD family membrane protein YckC
MAKVASAKPPPTLARAFVTPEGVDLRLEIGSAGQRMAAFLIDAAIIVAALTAMTIAAILLGIGAGSAAGMAGVEMTTVIWLLIAFVLRNFYFTGFELTAAAATPGKRAMGLRVAARDGGRLRAESVFARNAMRELEVFLPVTTAFGGAEGGVDGWMSVLAFGWAAVFLFFPLFNRDRLRAGDLIGGTWVVRAPLQKLGRDMADDGAGRLARYSFSREQLEAYGAKELHVLEEVLRARDRRTLKAVRERIIRKIGWPEADVLDDYDFLSAYYAALRGRLESGLLMGVRRRDKYDVQR